MKMEIELPEPPEGYEYTGEYRRANHTEYYMDSRGQKCVSCNPVTMGKQFILRKIEKWRKVTNWISDHGKKARFKNSKDQEWFYCTLVGYYKNALGDPMFISLDELQIKNPNVASFDKWVSRWSFCEILDES